MIPSLMYHQRETIKTVFADIHCGIAVSTSKLSAALHNKKINYSKEIGLQNIMNSFEKTFSNLD